MSFIYVFSYCQFLILLIVDLTERSMSLLTIARNIVTTDLRPRFTWFCGDEGNCTKHGP